MSELFSIPTAFALAAAFALVAGVLAYATVPETHVSEAKTAIKPWEIETTVPALTVGLVNFGLYFAYLGALFSTLVLFLAANDFSVLGYGPQATSGVLMAITVLSASVLMLGGGVVSDRLGMRVPVLCAFLVVSFVGFLLLTVAESVGGLVLACAFIGAGQGGTSGPLIALLADLTPDERTGRAMGTNNVLGDVGGGLGPMVSLPLVESVGFSPVYAACAVVPLFAGCVLVYGVYHQTGSVSPRTSIGD